MRRWFELMLASQEDLARLMTTEQGKPLAESKGEVAYAASFLEWFGEEAKRSYGDTIPHQQPDKRLLVVPGVNHGTSMLEFGDDGSKVLAALRVFIARHAHR